MWLKLDNGDYELLENGLALVARGEPVKGYHVGIQRPNTFPPVSIVQKGYKTREDAQAALDELMDGETYSMVQPPIVPEELNEDEAEKDKK
jgi:hypothetical protein